MTEKVESTETVDAQATEVTEEPVMVPAVREEHQNGDETHYPEVRRLNLFDTQEPAEIIQRASDYASALADVIKQKKLFTKIGDKEHVLVEGWTLLGSMLGVFPVLVECEAGVFPDKTKPNVPTATVNGYYAIVEARLMDGTVVGKAKALCLRNESRWAKADDYAIASMAQTRATSKALRQPLGFVVTLAGFAATPAEEIPRESGAPRAERMREKIGLLCIQIDKLQGRQGGYTFNAINEQSRIEYEMEVMELVDARDEDALAAIGTALVRMRNEVQEDPEKNKEREFVISAGDALFSDISGGGGYE